MNVHAIFLVAAREVRAALRSRWFALAAGAFLALSLAIAWLGLAGAQRSGLAGFDRTTASVLNLALLFVPLVTLSVGGMSLAGELEDGSLAQLLAQPLSRAEVYAGKYLGLLAAVSAAVLGGFGAAGLVVGWNAGSGNAPAFVALVGLLVALSAATLAMGMLLSAALANRARVVGASFVLWLALVYLGDLGTIGLVIARNLAPPRVFALALLNPVQEARVLGTLALSNRPEVLGPAALYGLDTFGPKGMPAVMLGGLALAGLLPFAAGYALFRRTVVL
jgi:Cu-processing system permease protein